MGKVIKKSASVDQRKNWVALLGELADQVESWATSMNWPVARQEKLIEERAIGSYAADVVHIKTPQGILIVEPVAREIMRGDGRVDMYAFPTLRRVVIVREGDKWTFYSDSSVRLSKSWKKDNFINLAKDLTSAI